MKLLVVGGGSIGERHIRNFKKIKGVDVSLCEPRQKPAQQLQEQYDLSEIILDYQQACLNKYDAVLIATPVDSHVTFAMQAVEANCHVLIEKPLSMTLDGIDALEELAHNKGLITGVAFVAKSHPIITEAKAIIDSGKLGKMCTGQMIMTSHLPLNRPDYKQGYFVKKEAGGGVTFDWAPHEINILCYLMGKVKEVMCVQNTFMLESETDDTATILLKMENGATIQLHVNAFQKHRQREGCIVGVDGQVEYDFEACRVSHFDGTIQSWRYNDYPVNYGEDLFEIQARNFINAIQGKEPIKTNIEDAKYTLKVVLAAMKAAQTHKFEKV